MTRSCARRSFAAETIFMALVICCVFLTERMRRRMSIKLGMSGYRLFRYEAGFELFDGVGHLFAQVVVERLLGADVIEDGGVRVLDEPVELLFEFAAAVRPAGRRGSPECRRR